MFDVEDFNFTTSYFRRDRLGDAGDASQDASLRLDAGLVVRDRAVSWSVISKGSISAMSFDSSTASTRGLQSELRMKRSKESVSMRRSSSKSTAVKRSSGGGRASP